MGNPKDDFSELDAAFEDIEKADTASVKKRPSRAKPVQSEFLVVLNRSVMYEGHFYDADTQTHSISAKMYNHYKDRTYKGINPKFKMDMVGMPNSATISAGTIIIPYIELAA